MTLAIVGYLLGVGGLLWLIFWSRARIDRRQQAASDEAWAEYRKEMRR